MRGEIVLSRVRIKPKPGVGESSTVTFKYARSNWCLNSPAQRGHWGSFGIPHKSSLPHLGLWASPALPGARKWAKGVSKPRPPQIGGEWRYCSNCEGRIVLRAQISERPR
ncbi:unnamed protein product [Tuber melanosporum]|uniref:(Perigord truffle) hypothetical protein n=1 Tax=Tuber melanosporum (strain Mel28) TaxID=656061 RepID=D5G4F2_TUBMM|nr:uncharacterized protein GSTUM_00004082001 [Tuber melanosporum]CAZ79395.1 unnamed protein product [Tuber melanosporum]